MLDVGEGHDGGLVVGVDEVDVVREPTNTEDRNDDDKHLDYSSFELISEEEIISWRSGRKINLNNNIKRLKIGKSNEIEDSVIHTKNILVLDKQNNILGIAYLDESYEIKPKVVFNAIG